MILFFPTEDRWVWRTTRSPNPNTRGVFSPFSPFTSANFPSESSVLSSFPEAPLFPEQFDFSHDENIDLIAGDNQGKALASTTFENSFPQSSVTSNLFINNPELLQNSNSELPTADQFSNPNPNSVLGTVTTPTSNHLPTEPDLLISSYSSLDINPVSVDEFGESVGNGRPPIPRSVFNGHSNSNRNTIEPFSFRPLPIDISTLPLESVERAAGIRKLWSSITSRQEFAELFDSLTSNTNGINSINTQVQAAARVTSNNERRESDSESLRQNTVSESATGLNVGHNQQQTDQRVQQEIQQQRRQQLQQQLLQEQQEQDFIQHILKLSNNGQPVQLKRVNFDTVLESATSDTTRNPTTVRRGKQNVPRTIQFFNLDFNRRTESNTQVFIFHRHNNILKKIFIYNT